MTYTIFHVDRAMDIPSVLPIPTPPINTMQLSKTLDILLPSRKRQLHLQRRPIPQVIRLLVHPTSTLGGRFHIKMPQQLGENQAHFRVCKTRQLDSIMILDIDDGWIRLTAGRYNCEGRRRKAARRTCYPFRTSCPWLRCWLAWAIALGWRSLVLRSWWRSGRSSRGIWIPMSVKFEH